MGIAARVYVDWRSCRGECHCLGEAPRAMILVGEGYNNSRTRSVLESAAWSRRPGCRRAKRMNAALRTASAGWPHH